MKKKTLVILSMLVLLCSTTIMASAQRPFFSSTENNKSNATQWSLSADEMSNMVSVKCSCSNPSATNIVVTDESGNIFYSNQFKGASGSISLQNLSTGKYVVRVRNGQNTEFLRLNVQ